MAVHLGEADLLSKTEARELLQAHRCTVLEIVRVDLHSILYLGASRRPMTAWLTRARGRREIRTQSGFPAEPAYGLLPRPELDRMYPATDEIEEMDRA